MNKTTIALGVIVLLIIGGGLFYAGQMLVPPSESPTPITATSSISVNNPAMVTAPISKSGVPVVLTNSSSSVSDTTAVVSGLVTPKGSFTSYWYEYGLSPDLGSKISSQSQTIGSGFVAIATPSYLTGLAKNTKYYFRLIAENQYGRIAGLQYSFQTTEGSPVPIGGVPSVKTIGASTLSSTSATLNGEVNPNRASTQYWFEYGQGPNLGNTTAFTSIRDDASTRSVAISLAGLSPATTYYFRLNAQNQFGTINGSILNAKTLASPSEKIPVVVTRNATNLSTSTATFHATVSPSGTETTYWFEYSTTATLSSGALISTEHQTRGAAVQTTSTESKVVGLRPKTTYYFRSAALNNFGVVRGEILSFKTK